MCKKSDYHPHGPPEIQDPDAGYKAPDEKYREFWGNKPTKALHGPPEISDPEVDPESEDE